MCPFGRKFDLTNSRFGLSAVVSGRDLRSGRAFVPCSSGRDCQFIIQNSRFIIGRNCSTFSGRSLRPDHSWRTDSNSGRPAAERTGLLSSSARMQPSARGRLRAAGRSATELAGKHFHLNRRLRVAAASRKPQFKIQYSKFGMTKSDRSLRSACSFGHELRASAVQKDRNPPLRRSHSPKKCLSCAKIGSV